MIHSHSSGKHSLLKKMLAVCIAFAMICSVSISAFSVEASSENTDETVQSVMTEEAGDPEVAEAETDSEQTPGEEQTEEPEVTPPEDNMENPDADNAEPTPSEDNEQPADPTVTEQPEEPTVTEQPTATPTQVEELERIKQIQRYRHKMRKQSGQHLHQHPQQHILGKQQFIILPILQEIHGQMIQEHGHRHRKQVIQ